MTRFVIEYVDRTECRIIVEGRVTLPFQNLEGQVWCMPTISHDRKPARVPRKDFLDARKLAIDEMAEAEKKSYLSDTQIAIIILANVNKAKNLGVESALDSFIKVAGWCSSTRRAGIMREIGKIGGAASTQRAMKKKVSKEKERKREKEKARQGTLSFT